MIGRLIYLKDVVSLKLDLEKCMGCGICISVCPQAVLSLTNGKIEIANRDACMECGACANNCPVEALDVRSGVGCATAVINSMLGRKNAPCSCTIDSDEKASETAKDSQDNSCSNCC